MGVVARMRHFPGASEGVQERQRAEQAIATARIRGSAAPAAGGGAHRFRLTPPGPGA